MIDLLKKSFIQQKVVEEIKHVNMHLNIPYMSKTDDYTYFKVILSTAITYEETSLYRTRIIARNLSVNEYENE
jgi:hypothetical protein